MKQIINLVSAMTHMDKYYLHTSSGYKNTRSYIIRNNANIDLSFGENIEIPNFDLYIDKLEEGKFKRPQNSKYDKYKEIVKEVYDSYLRLAFKSITNCKWDAAEYYLDQKSSTWTDIAMYTTDPKNKFCIHIDIRDSVSSLMLMLGKSGSFSHRQGYRKNAKPISEAIFVSILKETIKFMEDGNSYNINVTNYLEKIKVIVSGNLIEVRSDKFENVDQLINQLELKKGDITSRLIENDSDTENTRAALRGEKEGIDYSLKAIKKFFRLSK